MTTVILSLLLLLAAPGPTNALLFAAGISTKTAPFRLMFAALAGYGIAIAAGVGVIGPLAEANPQLVLPLRLLPRWCYSMLPGGSGIATRGLAPPALR